MKPQTHRERVLFEALLQASWEIAKDGAQGYARMLIAESEVRLGKKMKAPKLLLTRVQTRFKDAEKDFKIEVGS